MTTDNLKTNVLQIKVSDSQNELIDTAYRQYLQDQKCSITRTAFIREQLMFQCMVIAKMIEFKKEKDNENNQ